MSAVLPQLSTCLLYTSDAADEEDSVDLGGRRIIKKKTFNETSFLRSRYDNATPNLFWLFCALLGVLCSIRIFCGLHFRRHIFASLWGAFLRFASLWRANSRGDSCVLGVNLSKVCWGLIFCLRKAYIDLCLLICPRRSSFRSLLLSFTLD